MRDRVWPTPWLDGDTSYYGVWSERPPIFFMPSFVHNDALAQTMDPLFDRLSDERAWFFVLQFWHRERPRDATVILDWERTHRSSYPLHQFVHLCNTERQTEVFSSAGLDALFCSHNCLVDERVFYPRTDVERRFDAVFDARINRFKRHELAADVESLALLYARAKHNTEPVHVWRIRRALAHAHDFNREAGQGRYRALDAPAIADRLAMCRVGLCLSAVEGANFASMQYLMSGLTVVSTASEGGRDVFFDPRTTMIVEADPAAVRRGVAEMVSRTVDAEDVRATTMSIVDQHRRRLKQRLQRIYDSEGIQANVDDEWDTRFFDKMMSNRQSHRDVIQSLDDARSQRSR